MRPHDLITKKLNIKNHACPWTSIIPKDKSFGQVEGDMRKDMFCSSKDLLAIDVPKIINKPMTGFYYKYMLNYRLRGRKRWDASTQHHLVKWQYDGWVVEAHTHNHTWPYLIGIKRLPMLHGLVEGTLMDIWCVSIAVPLTWS